MPSLQELQQALPLSNKLHGVDVETTGLDFTHPSFSVVGVGVATSTHSFYIDIPSLSPECSNYLNQFLSAVPLVAFNTYFDGGALMRMTGKWLNWVGCSFGLFKQMSLEGNLGQRWGLETAQQIVLGWPVSNKDAVRDALKERKLPKARMAELPADILGPYCAMDADAALQLWDVLMSSTEKFPFRLWRDYHQKDFMTEVKLLVEQCFRGIVVEQNTVHKFYSTLQGNITASLDKFLLHPPVYAAVTKYNEAVRQEWRDAEPPKHKANGEVTKRWLVWKDKDILETKGFNPNSKKQLQWLFFNELGMEPLSYTVTGQCTVDKKTLPKLGTPGELLNSYNLQVKTRGYVEKVIKVTARDGLLHSHWKSCGTVTTRLAGNLGFNFQQQPKIGAYLEAFQARPGYKLIQADADSLEPTILTAFSKDKTMWSLYGPNAKPNDIYLYNMAKLGIDPKLAEVYDPDNPTKESIALAKSLFKQTRTIGKIVTLAGSYGAGPRTLHQILTDAKVDITEYQVKKIHRKYWELYSGIKVFEAELLTFWRNNRFIPSMYGTPLAISDKLTRDAVNRFCQTSGHQFLQKWIFHIDELREQNKTEMHPWLLDLHDETIWSAPEAHAEAASEIVAEALKRANEETDMEINIKTTVEIFDNLAQIKDESWESIG